MKFLHGLEKADRSMSKGNPALSDASLPPASQAFILPSLNTTIRVHLYGQHLTRKSNMESAKLELFTDGQKLFGTLS